MELENTHRHLDMEGPGKIEFLVLQVIGIFSRNFRLLQKVILIKLLMPPSGKVTDLTGKKRTHANELASFWISLYNNDSEGLEI